MESIQQEMFIFLHSTHFFQCDVYVTQCFQNRTGSVIMKKHVQQHKCERLLFPVTDEVHLDHEGKKWLIVPVSVIFLTGTVEEVEEDKGFLKFFGN